MTQGHGGFLLTSTCSSLRCFNWLWQTIFLSYSLDGRELGSHPIYSLDIGLKNQPTQTQPTRPLYLTALVILHF